MSFSDVLNPSFVMYEFFFLDEMLDVVAVVASEHGGGSGGNEHAPASMLVGLLFFVFLNLITAG